MIHIYTGDGKGKTTAALGLALRASGAGMNVFIGQFLKGKRSSELLALKKIKNIHIEQFGQTCFIRKKPTTKDFILAHKGIERISCILQDKRYRMVILDEINVAIKFGLIPLEKLTGILKRSALKKEVILTGRYAPKILIKMADLVSEIREAKHYFRKGIKARKGIEF